MKLPRSFLDLHEHGRFDYWGGKKYHDMDAAERTRLFTERRNEVLWMRGIEWDVPPEGVSELDWARPGLFAFAGNGGGDQYAWYPAWQGDAPEPPVILVMHDEYVSTVFAPSFALTLYRLWLEHGADWDVLYDGSDRESALHAWAGIIAPVLDADTRATLEALAVDLDRTRMRTTRDAFVASLPTTELPTALLPTRYNPEYVKGANAERAYAKSIAFFEALVEEGHEGFRRHAEEARANRDAALSLAARAERLRAIVSPKAPKTAKPVKAKPAEAKPAKKPAKPAKKGAPKKGAPKKAAPKKVTKAKPAKKATPKKAAPKKVTKAKPAKKAAPAKAKPAKKVAPKKVTKAKPAKKATPKKAAPKKAPR